jgi:hypothetical protein
LLDLQIIFYGEIDALFYSQVPGAVLGIPIKMKNQGEKKNPTAVPLHLFFF